MARRRAPMNIEIRRMLGVIRSETRLLVVALHETGNEYV